MQWVPRCYFAVPGHRACHHRHMIFVHVWCPPPPRHIGMMALKAALAACAAVLAYQYVRAPYVVPDFVGYNVGFPKTGTLAVSDMFAKAGFQSAHEFDRDRLLLPVLQKLANDDTAPLRAYLLRERPARMRAQFGRPALHMDRPFRIRRNDFGTWFRFRQLWG